MSGQANNSSSIRLIPISPDDVKKCLRVIFYEFKDLQSTNLTYLKNWVISRPKEVLPYHCFLFISTHCSLLKTTLPYRKLMELIDKMILQVSQCLSYVLLPKKKLPGKNSKWYTVDEINYPKYPRKSHYPWISYDKELLKERSQKMLKKTLVQQREYIESCYNDAGVYQSLDFSSYKVVTRTNTNQTPAEAIVVTNCEGEKNEIEEEINRNNHTKEATENIREKK